MKEHEIKAEFVKQMKEQGADPKEIEKRLKNWRDWYKDVPDQDKPEMMDSEWKD